MTEKPNALSLVATGLTALLAVWTGYRITVFVPAFAQTFAGLGAELPMMTRIVITIPSSFYLLVGLTMAALLIAKDLGLDRERARSQINLIAAILCFAFYMFFHSVMIQPAMNIIKQIG